jgi:hypothetical protein
MNLLPNLIPVTPCVVMVKDISCVNDCIEFRISCLRKTAGENLPAIHVLCPRGLLRLRSVPISNMSIPHNE